MATLNILYNDELRVNDSIKIYIPKVGEILEDEDAYYSLVSALTAMPIDMMVPLDDAGIDYTQINEYDLFLILFMGIAEMDTHLVFGDLDLKKFKLVPNEKINQVVLRDEENNITIDRAIHGQIAAGLRKIHHLERNYRKPGNDETKDYMLQRERAKAKRKKKRLQESQIESLIIAMVNCPEFKYDYEGTKNLTIYQFNESVRQVIKRVDYNNLMHGVYSGTVSVKDVSKDSLNWLTHK